jgi:diamine N-acetyltransferase
MIRGSKINLRALEIVDADLFLEWENAEDAREHSGFYQPVSAYLAEQFIAHSNRPVQEVGQLRLVIESLDKQQIGLMDIYDIDFPQRRAALGVYIAPEFRQKGFAIEAIQLMTTYAFDTLNLELLYADIRAHHQTSLKAFARAGFGQEVLLPGWQLDKGMRHTIYRLFRSFTD